MSLNTQRDKRLLTTKELCIFALLGSVMYCSKWLMEFLPNIHLVGALSMAYTLVYRYKALIPIYVFVFLCGLFGGFSAWWIPHLYVWLPIWIMAMILPRNMGKWGVIVYPVVCALHGLSFGVLYAPAQALLFGLNWDGMIAWIIAGIPFDLIHSGGNFVAGFLVVPVVSLLKKINNLSFL